jgi:hypothetical protein
MPTVHEKADDEIAALVAEIMKEHHWELAEAGVTIGCLIATNPDAAAVKLHGYPCDAVVRIVPLKQRVHGMPDAEIVIDGGEWETLPDERRRALIDHELTHLTLALDKKTKKPKTDDLGRPKLKMRLHDWELGGFAEIAKRHGDAAPEKRAFRNTADKYGQLLLSFAESN